MVCLGNICRSPLAEGIMHAKLEKAGLDGFIVDSAGTGGWHAGEKPDKRSIAVAHRNGVDLNNQRARKFQKEDFDQFDYIFVMDQANKKDVLALAENDSQRAIVHLFLPFCGISDPSEVPDPWHGTESDFEAIYSLLDTACGLAVSKLLKSSH
jgi:protein-tyrosine phosphatase